MFKILNVTTPKLVENTDNIDNTNSIYNIKQTSSCGSGKKYKNCCGR